MTQQNWWLKKKSFFPFWEHSGKFNPHMMSTPELNHDMFKATAPTLLSPYNLKDPSIHLNGLRSCSMILMSCSASKKLEWTLTPSLDYCTVDHFQNHCHFCCIPVITGVVIIRGNISKIFTQITSVSYHSIHQVDVVADATILFNFAHVYSLRVTSHKHWSFTFHLKI